MTRTIVDVGVAVGPAPAGVAGAGVVTPGQIGAGAVCARRVVAAVFDWLAAIGPRPAGVARAQVTLGAALARAIVAGIVRADIHGIRGWGCRAGSVFAGQAGRTALAVAAGAPCLAGRTFLRGGPGSFFPLQATLKAKRNPKASKRSAGDIERNVSLLGYVRQRSGLFVAHLFFTHLHG